MYLENLWIHCDNIYTKYTFLRTSYYRLRDCLRDRLRLPPTGAATGSYNGSAGAFLDGMRLLNHDDDGASGAPGAPGASGAPGADENGLDRPKNPPRFVRILDFRLRRVFRIYYT